MQYVIYGETYELQEVAAGVPDAYAVRGELVDDPPKGKCVGYVTMEDGSLIQCYKRLNVIPIVASAAVLALVGVGVCLYLFVLQPKDVYLPGTDTVIKQGDDTNIITYNGFMSVTPDNQLDIHFANGSEVTTISISGEGIESTSWTLQPYETLEYLPVTYTTEYGLITATLSITTATSTAFNEVAIEIPDNNTPNSPAVSLDGYWKGEYIYGTGVAQ